MRCLLSIIVLSVCLGSALACWGRVSVDTNDYQYVGDNGAGGSDDAIGNDSPNAGFGPNTEDEGQDGGSGGNGGNDDDGEDDDDHSDDHSQDDSDKSDKSGKNSDNSGKKSDKSGKSGSGGSGSGENGGSAGGNGQGGGDTYDYYGGGGVENGAGPLNPGAPPPPGWENAGVNWPPPAGGRNAQEASKQTATALDNVFAVMTAGDVANIPKETLRQVPASSLAKLSDDVIVTLPEEVLAKLTLDANVKSRVIGEMVQFLPVDKVVTLPWETIITGIPPDALNSYSPTILGAIPWDSEDAVVINKVPADTMGGLTADTLSIIPARAWRKVSFQQLSAIKPNTLSSLPISSLRMIPPGHLKRLGPQKLGAFSKDVLIAVDPSLLTDVIERGSALRGPSAAASANIAAETIGQLGGSARRRRAAMHRGEKNIE